MGVINVDAVRSGQVIRFNYHGAERSGYRLVEVGQNDGTYIKGVDKEKNEPRQYRYDRINSAIELVANTHEEVISPALFLTDSSIPVDRAAAIFKLIDPDRADTVRVAYGLIIARRKDLPRFSVTLSADTVVVEFTNQNGEVVGIKMNHQNPNTTHAVYTCSPSKTDYETFVSNLNQQTFHRNGGVASGGRVIEIDSKGAAEVKGGTRWEDMLKNRVLTGTR
jgi:hypothetical protein